MKNCLILAFIFVSISYSKNTNAQGIDFYHDKSFKELLEMAKKQDKLVFMDCYTSWCGPCKRLASQVFPDTVVGNFFNTTFVNTKFDMEKDEGITIATKYAVRAYPTLLWLDADGSDNELHLVLLLCHFDHIQRRQ